jgi:flavin-dependent dehydrogenase
MSSGGLGDRTNVLVVGGGPGGSTAATLLARKGWRVLLAEKDRHPRFHIGESLLPMNVPIFEELGVLDAVRAIGTVKLGADFPAPTERGYNVFRFDRTLNPGRGYAFQVRRADFDQLLFTHAGKSGVTTLEGARVTRVELGPEAVTATIVSAERELTVRADYIIDASGRDTLLGSLLHLKRKHARHKSAALFAHFEGVARRPGADAGNISIYRFGHGWIWLIPLTGNCMSVGAVCSPDYLKERKGDQAEFLLETLAAVPDVRERLRGARILDHLQATGNYSYVCNRISGHRWIMVGDAYSFLDPIFSSGVYLAMHSARLAAQLVDAVLREPARERTLQRRYAREVKQGLSLLGWFIFRFTSPAMRYLFANPRNVLRVEEAMISMLAGDVFRTRRVWWRLQLFKVLYLIASATMWREALASRSARRRPAT